MKLLSNADTSMQKIHFLIIINIMFCIAPLSCFRHEFSWIARVFLVSRSLSRKARPRPGWEYGLRLGIRVATGDTGCDWGYRLPVLLSPLRSFASFHAIQSRFRVFPFPAESLFASRKSGEESKRAETVAGAVARFD